VRAAETPELWHRRLGHAGFETLAKMAEGNLVGGVGVIAAAFRERKTVVCKPCIQGKHTRAPFPKESTSPPSTEPLQLVHMDVCGPMPVASKGGKRYLATYLDDYSRLSVVEPIASKSDVVARTQAVFARLELQTGKKVRAIQTDRGGIRQQGHGRPLRKRGTVHRTTAGNAPEQNGAAERLNRDLEEKGRALLSDSGLGADLWAEALVTANYTRNRLPSSVHERTPWEMFFGEKPGVSHIRVFGAPAYLHIPKVRRQKMEPVSERAVFLGYAADSKAYRVQRVRDGRVMIARDVIVNETQSQTSVTVELSSGEEKGSGGARGLSRVSPPTQMGAGDTST
jgi:transposase InsO family protein